MCYEGTILYLFGELFFTEFVQCEEFPSKDDVLNETNTGKLHTDNDLSIGNHHGYGTEVDLQVLWQFLSTGIPRVLERENRKVFSEAQVLTFKASPIICSRRQFQILPLFQK